MKEPIEGTNLYMGLGAGACIATYLVFKKYTRGAVLTNWRIYKWWIFFGQCYFAVPLLIGQFMDGEKPEMMQYVGAGLCLLGVCLIIYKL